MNADEKACPDCAETIKEAAKVCRFCGFRMDDMAGRLAEFVRQQQEAPTSPSPSPEEARPQFHCPYCSNPTDEGRGICGHCQHWFKEGHPKEGQQATWSELASDKSGLTIIGGLVVIAGVLGMIFWSDAPEVAYHPPAPPERSIAAESSSTDADETEIVTICDLTVKGALAVEADMDFGWKFVPRSENEYRVVRGFKAQNAFGATLKHTYFCTYDAPAKRITKLEIEGPGGSNRII
ncbi:zinc ribbon domain-containing protein [Sphingobium sp.]|uniref:zinc ribbon domain-containing protein n=1 Tax=Sphingobium sp. TaxID=1912891 RepID=UPI000DB83E8D|nr:zinc ribbon domain-containing protein [Sphingobium sp.]PZU63217.1 MAG: hypothetical protein DI540_24420 [Sphingobium sp.]